MKSAVVVFPGINRETDMMLALEKRHGHKPVAVWHTETELPKVDLVVVPGGFSYGDYLRCGAIAARSPIMEDIRAKVAERTKGSGRLQRLPDHHRGRLVARRPGAQCPASIRLP